MPIVSKSSCLYILGIFLSFIFAEYSRNFPDTAYLFLVLTLSIFFNFRKIDKKLSFLEIVNFTTAFSFLFFSFYWLFKSSYNNDLPNFLYPFLTVAFNLLFPYFYAQGSKYNEFSKNAFFAFFVFTAAIAIWQLYAVNYLYGLDYLYRNERIKSALFQGEPRLSSIFVSANNYSIYLAAFFSFIIVFMTNSLKKLLFLFSCIIICYLTYVRKTYILLLMLVLLYLLLPYISKMNKKLAALVLISTLIFIATSLAFFSVVESDGLLSSQTLSSRYSQWDYFFGKYVNSNLFNIFFGDYILQSSFEKFGYNVLYLDNNLLMVLIFGGLFLFIPYTITIIYFLYFFLKHLTSSNKWAKFGIMNWFIMAWVGMFSNLIDNHEVNFIVFGCMWLTYFRIKTQENIKI